MLKNNLTLSKFFSNGPAIVVAFDHGMFAGPIPGIDKVHDIPSKILPDIDAVLMSPGMLTDIGPELCGRRHAPLAITRIDWSTIFCGQWNYHSGDNVKAFTPRQALKMGAQMVLICLTLNTGSPARDAKNVELFTDLCNQAHELNMPVVAEYFPVNDENISEEDLYQEVKIGCRIIYELGADLIKTFYTKNFEDVVSGCPTPILPLGGARLDTDLEALKYAQKQIASGAAGIVFGRNVFQSKNPLQIQKALIDVVKKKIPAEQAANNHGLVT